MIKQLYKWHRRLSVVIAVPVLLWASSGFMHPLMTNIRPAIATQGWPSLAIDSGRLRCPLPEALRKHHLDSFAAVRLVHIDTNWFYQVQPAVRRAGAGGSGAAGFGSATDRALAFSPAIQPTVPVYLSCVNGNVLAAGDWLYAQYLARHFLEGGAEKGKADAMPAGKQIATPVVYTEGAPDCCGAATECVLHPARGAKVANVSLLTGYDKEYKSINRLLPVYRVSFDRPDGIRIYVETTQDRFSFAMDNRRAFFDGIFGLFHTWGWLDVLGKGRLVVELGFALLAFCTVLLGVYLFFTTRGARVNTTRGASADSTRAAKAKNNGLVRARRYHRYTAIVAAMFTLMWSFSGGYHALTKLAAGTEPVRQAVNFSAADAGFDYARLRAAAGRPMANISLVKIEDQLYWRTSLFTENGSAHKDLMKDGRATLPPVLYVHAGDYRVLPEGDQHYAASLAAQYRGQTISDAQFGGQRGSDAVSDAQFGGQGGGAALSVSPVTAFDDEYNFTDKRLPVWRVSYPGEGHPRYYVETSSGQLAAFVNDAVWREGYSFSVFHKHHFMDWGGKTVRDGSTMFWAAMQVLMAVIGLSLFVRYRISRRRQDRTA